MSENVSYSLQALVSGEDWRIYHAIRRKVLFENRGLFDVYKEDGPDEFAEGNHPMLLIHQGESIGVIRIDIDGEFAVFRRVAIREDVQRCGHGKVMLALAEDFARAKGCRFVKSFVDPGAVGFYERCGFEREDSAMVEKRNVLMFKKWT